MAQVGFWLGETGGESDPVQKLAHGDALARLVDLLDQLVELGDLVLVMLALELVHTGDQLFHLGGDRQPSLTRDEAKDLSSLLNRVNFLTDNRDVTNNLANNSIVDWLHGLAYDRLEELRV